MRKIRYLVAISLDGYIAGPADEFDWIISDPEIDFKAIFDQFGTLLMGRRTFDIMQRQENPLWADKEVIVCSRTLEPDHYPEVTIISENLQSYLTSIVQQTGKDIWLFGGGILFKRLLEMDMVDTVEVAIIPILLGDGIPFLPSPAKMTELKFQNSTTFESTGIVSLQYQVIKNE